MEREDRIGATSQDEEERISRSTGDNVDRNAREREERKLPQREPLKPGEKQPPPKPLNERAAETVERLQELRTELVDEERLPSAERARRAREGDSQNNPVPPHERKPPIGPAVSSPAAIAAGHISAAEAAIQTHDEAERRIQSDPRFERDQKVYELGQQGKLAAVPPSEEELAKRGLPDEAPRTPEEQVAKDMPRLEEAERRTALSTEGSAETTSGDPAIRNLPVRETGTEVRTRESAVAPGEQQGIPRNNLTSDAKGENKTVGGAEGEVARARAASAETGAVTQQKGAPVNTSNKAPSSPSEAAEKDKPASGTVIK